VYGVEGIRVDATSLKVKQLLPDRVQAGKQTRKVTT
jgi:hypothetical protein